ncbi:hypothetical protein [Fodinicola acaciae]|uniref:hypothetical protein n=1 Tax=Fodinicola acaciae TaxID=2681555 RepID=UPI0013D2EA5F|nr:hypothetical protein [Fodinicola acaciae]
MHALQSIEDLKKVAANTRDAPAFLDLAERATNYVMTHWEEREHVARIMAGVWMSLPATDRSPALDEIGGAFADLELPDAHIHLTEGMTVRGRWARLAAEIHAGRSFI